MGRGEDIEGGGVSVPLERRSEVPCHKCGYHFRRAHMIMVVPLGADQVVFECVDQVRCVRNVRERARLDAWKRGQR